MKIYLAHMYNYYHLFWKCGNKISRKIIKYFVDKINESLKFLTVTLFDKGFLQFPWALQGTQVNSFCKKGGTFDANVK